MKSFLLRIALTSRAHLARSQDNLPLSGYPLLVKSPGSYFKLLLSGVD